MTRQTRQKLWWIMFQRHRNYFAELILRKRKLTGKDETENYSAAVALHLACITRLTRFFYFPTTFVDKKWTRKREKSRLMSLWILWRRLMKFWLCTRVWSARGTTRQTTDGASTLGQWFYTATSGMMKRRCAMRYGKLVADVSRPESGLCRSIMRRSEEILARKCYEILQSFSSFYPFQWWIIYGWWTDGSDGDELLIVVVADRPQSYGKLRFLIEIALVRIMAWKQNIWLFSGSSIIDHF